jgi:hypothetical protein
MLQMPEKLSLSIDNLKVFWERTTMGCKIGVSEAIQKRLDWENLIFFAAQGYYILSIHDSQLHVLKQFLWVVG